MDLFTPNLTFFGLHFLQLVLLEISAFFLIYYSGYSNWFTYLLAAVLMAASQAQAGWLQHDLGHLAVFKSNDLNRLGHKFIMGAFKGVKTFIKRL
jgi:fatty acid desaturase 2 (delta-6 desaturase)